MQTIQSIGIHFLFSKAAYDIEKLVDVLINSLYAVRNNLADVRPIIHYTLSERHGFKSK